MITCEYGLENEKMEELENFLPYNLGGPLDSTEDLDGEGRGDEGLLALVENLRTNPGEDE